MDGIETYESLDRRTAEMRAVDPKVNPEVAWFCEALIEDVLRCDPEMGKAQAMLEAKEQIERVYYATYGYSLDFWRDVDEDVEQKLRRDAYREKGKKEIKPWLRKLVFERDAYRCLHCGGWENLCADHIIPESKGGPTTLDNLQTLCRSCNSRKGAKMPENSPSN